MLERKEIESIYSMSFYSFDLNDGKMDCVRRKADRILSFKNSLSIFIYSEHPDPSSPTRPISTAS